MYTAWERMESHAPGRKKRPKATAFSPVSFFRILRITQKKCNVSLLLVYFQSTNLITVFYSNMAEGNDPLFTIAHAWLQVTPSVRPCSFTAMRIPHGGMFHYDFLTNLFNLYGLHLLQDSYPCWINSSLVPVNSSLLLSFI